MWEISFDTEHLLSIPFMEDATKFLIEVTPVYLISFDSGRMNNKKK